MVYTDGAVYEGAWRYNKRHGHGVYTYPNGDIHVGYWFTGKKHGAGKYSSSKQGSRIVGLWSNGELDKARAPDRQQHPLSFTSRPLPSPATRCPAAQPAALPPHSATRGPPRQCTSTSRAGERESCRRIWLLFRFRQGQAGGQWRVCPLKWCDGA